MKSKYKSSKSIFQKVKTDYQDPEYEQYGVVLYTEHPEDFSLPLDVVSLSLYKNFEIKGFVPMSSSDIPRNAVTSMGTMNMGIITRFV